MNEEQSPVIKAALEDLRLSVLPRLEQMAEKLVEEFRQSAARIESMSAPGPQPGCR
jgi:hypothetical protein